MVEKFEASKNIGEGVIFGCVLERWMRKQFWRSGKMEVEKDSGMNGSGAVLIAMWERCRNEIEMRIKQRDNIALQYIIAVGTVLAVGLQNIPNSHYLIPWLIPPLSWYYSLQILYSYLMHDRLHYYIAYTLEPQIRREFAFADNLRLWERECDEISIMARQKVPGVRKPFFEKVPWFSTVFSALLFLLLMSGRGGVSMHFYLGSTVRVLCTIASVLFLIVSTLGWGIELPQKVWNWVRVCFYPKVCVLRKFRLMENAIPNCLGEEDAMDLSMLKSKGEFFSAKKVVFVDRDGTLHRDAVNTYRIDDLELLDGVVEGLRKLQNAGFGFIIVSNQDGIKRGLYSRTAMHAFNMNLVRELGENGVKNIVAIYYSPHHREEDHPSFKPNCGMFIKAARELKVDLSRAYMIGDQEGDMIAAVRAGVRPVLVLTGIYPKNFVPNGAYGGVVVPSFSEFSKAADWIVDDCRDVLEME